MHTCFVLLRVLKFFFWTSQLVNGDVVFIKLFPKIAVRFGNISSVLIQGWILKTLWRHDLHFPTCHWCPHCSGVVYFYVILQEGNSLLSKHGWESVLHLQFYLCDTWKNFPQTRLCLCTFQIFPPPPLSYLLLVLGSIGSSHIMIWLLVLHLYVMIQGKSVPWQLRIFLEAILMPRRLERIFLYLNILTYDRKLRIFMPLN